MKILAVYGASRQESHSLLTTQIMAQAALAHGAEVTHLNLMETPLPMMRIDQDFSADSGVQQIKQLTREAEAFMLVSPEYHGCMSNWIKNFFDFHYHEFAGKLFALAATTGGSMGVSCNTQMRIAVQHCHGWVLPYQTAVRSSDVGADGGLANSRTRDRLQRMGRDLVIYGRLLQTQFQQDRHEYSSELASPPEQIGFAGWYA